MVSAQPIQPELGRLYSFGMGVENRNETKCKSGRGGAILCEKRKNKICYNLQPNANPRSRAATIARPGAKHTWSLVLSDLKKKGNSDSGAREGVRG